MIEILALALLILRLVAMGILATVLKKQWDLMQRPAKILDGYIENDVVRFRKHLFFLTLALAGSNLLPIAFDLFIIFDGLVFAWFTFTITEFLIVYTVSNTLSAVLAAWLIYKIYSDALTVDESHNESDHQLLNDE